MNILLVSENDSVRYQTDRILDDKESLEVLSFKELYNKTQWDYDVLIIDFDKIKVNVIYENEVEYNYIFVYDSSNNMYLYNIEVVL